MWQGCLWKILQAASCKAALVQPKCIRWRWTWDVGQAQGMNIWWRGWGKKILTLNFKRECGYQFTNKLEGMFNDMKLSSEMGGLFKDHLESAMEVLFLLWLKTIPCHWLPHRTLETGYWHLCHCAYINILAHESIFISQMHLATRSTASLQSIRAILFQPTQR